MTHDPTADEVPVLFLSGAGLPEWIWDDVREHLPAQRVAVATRPTNPTKSNLEDFGRQALEDAPEGPFTIVAHSLGAVIGLKVLELAPQRVDRFLSIAGIVPPLGGSFISAMPLPNRLILSLAMRFAGTRPPDKAIRSMLKGLDPDPVDRILDEFTAEPQELYRQRLDLKPRTTHAGYLSTSRDGELSQRLQNTFATNLRTSWTRTLETGHMPMLEDPAGTSEAITAFQNTVRAVEGG